MNNGVFWDVTPCGACKYRRFGGKTYLTRATRRNIPEDTILHHQSTPFLLWQASSVCQHPV
jgi:hypothetical protein